MRTFVAVADLGRFSDAAAELGVTQQAASKRVAALETELGVRLLMRTPGGARLTVDGQAFLPHARNLLDAAERAAASVRPGRRALRVDVLGRRLAAADLLQEFHRAHPDLVLDVVTLPCAEAGIAAVRDGDVDAAFCATTATAHLPRGLRTAHILDEALELLTGPRHELAGAGSMAPAELAGRPIWMPGIVAGTEWAAYYDELAAAFGLRIDASGPNFGIEHLLDTVAGSAERITFAGAGTHIVWPAHRGLRRIRLRDPAPVYPWSLVWRAGDRHPGLTALRAHLALRSPQPRGAGVWAPRGA